MKMLIAGLLMAAPLAAQPLPCTQTRTSRVVRNQVVRVGADSVYGFYVTRDSTRFRCRLTGRVDTVRIRDTVYVQVPVPADTTPPVVPPADTTTPPPPADTTTTPPPTPPPAGSTTWAWDWSTATGNTATALLDQSKTPPLQSYRTAANLPLLHVTPAAGFGFPTGMANVLTSTLNGQSSNDVRAVDQWPAPAPGQSIFFRLYVRYEIPNSYGTLGSASHHPIQPEPGSCPADWAWKIGSFTDGTLELGINFQGSGAGFYADHILRKDQTYRWEWAFHRQASGRYKADVRVYDAAGALVADDSRFISRWNPDYTTPLSVKDPDLTMSDGCLRRMMVGYNGPAWPLMTNSFARFGGWAVRIAGSPTAWIGPY